MGSYFEETGVIGQYRLTMQDYNNKKVFGVGYLFKNKLGYSMQVRLQLPVRNTPLIIEC